MDPCDHASLPVCTHFFFSEEIFFFKRPCDRPFKPAILRLPKVKFFYVAGYKRALSTTTPGNKADSSHKKKEKSCFVFLQFPGMILRPRMGRCLRNGIDFHSACPGLLFVFLFFCFCAFMQADSVSAVTLLALGGR